jgi:Rieske 2Fe-2S family protein
VYLEEQQRIFHKQWVCAGREEQIPEAGDFFVRTMGSESVIFVRARNGKIYAHHNVCRHRGARLCDEASGRFGNSIRCPYHSWAYGMDGRLVAAPFMDGVPDFDTGDYPLHPVKLERWEGFLYFSLAAEPEPFELSYADVIGRFSRYRIAELRRCGRTDYEVAANWKLVFENYSECYHCTGVHPALVKLSPADSGANDLVEGKFLGGYMEVKPGKGSMSLSGNACGLPVGSLPEADLHRVYYYTLFPNMLLSLHPDYVMVHTLWPQSCSYTRIECEWLFHPRSAEQPGFDPQDAIIFWDKTNREDWHICELSQLGISSSAYTPGPYSSRESISAAFDREYLRQMSIIC